MPIKFGPEERVKSTIDTYVIDKVLSQGAFAHAAKAKSTTKGGVSVFLKRYFSPTPAIPWYAGFVRHQTELKRRITSNDGVRQYCYGFVDFFEGTEGRGKKTFHQVFEFIDNGKALTKFIEEAELVTFAIVLMTDDDVGALKGSTLAPRTRQNVILELGYFLSHLGQERVCALITPGLETPSDFDGIVYIRMDEDGHWQSELKRELLAAGMPLIEPSPTTSAG